MSGNFTGRRRRGGDTADTEDVAGRIADAEARAITALPVDELPIETTTADKGYHSAAEIEQLEGSGIAANIPDRVHNRNPANLSGEARAALQSYVRHMKSTVGKDLLSKRGMHIERSFAHIHSTPEGCDERRCAEGKTPEAILHRSAGV